MITLTRDDRDLLVRAHRWARANGWRYDATTLDGALTDFRWRKEDGACVIVRMDHEMPSPWQLEVAVPQGASAELTMVSVGQTAAVVAALDVLPSWILRRPTPHFRADCPIAAKPGDTVICERCGRSYRLTPSSDFYCTSDGDHSCEPCLLAGKPLITINPGLN